MGSEIKASVLSISLVHAYLIISLYICERLSPQKHPVTNAVPAVASSTRFPAPALLKWKIMIQEQLEHGAGKKDSVKTWHGLMTFYTSRPYAEKQTDAAMRQLLKRKAFILRLIVCLT